jgi:ABC-type transporter Mla MlaB component
MWPSHKQAAPATVSVVGELDLAAIPGLRRAIASLDGGARTVLLDLSEATLTDSAGHEGVLHLRLLGSDRAEARVNGRRLRLSRRHSEIVALLAARPSGMTSDELAMDLYGDAGQPAAVRVEVCRLRKLLADCMESEPYRLAVDVESDVDRVQRLLERGAVREAAERYEGPLLPRSEAPGVVRQREALDSWIRHAVMTAEDHAALWAWLQSPSGSEDLPAWKRLLTSLNFHDPRRSLAAARVRVLREAYGTPGAGGAWARPLPAAA